MKTLTNLFIRSLLLTVVTSAQWSSDPASPQLLGSGVQAQVKATSDGGVYVAWLTDMGGYHVYLQRFDATGVAQFDDGGLLVSDNNNDSWIAVFHMNLAVDSDNNAIITVLDTRAGPWNVYAYKIAPDGSMLWGDDGVSVSNSSQTNYSPRLAVLPDNSVVVAWSPNSATVEIQRISSDGGLMWGDGILIEDNIESLMSPQPIVNSNGDALVQWIGQSGPVWAADSKIYLQKYDLDGNAQWDNPTVAVGPVVFPMGNWLQGIIADDTGGSFSAWTQFSGGVQNAVFQHITGEGAIAWTGGVDLSTNSSNLRMSPMLSVAEETQELMAVWKESNGSQSQRGIFAQRLDSSGNQLWGSNGVTMVALNSSYDYLDLSMAGFGEELISAYIQQSANMNGDIYANRLDAEGNLVWTGQTVTVTNSGTAKSDMMVGKGPNCLFIAWTENGSVYAHCLREDGTLGAPDVSSSDCIADDGTEGVEFWGECFSIENTTELGFPLVPDTATTFPEELFSLINLSSLSIWANITEPIPTSIANLTNLVTLEIVGIESEGAIPSEIGNLTNLTTLILRENEHTGFIPTEIGNLTNLISLDLSSNQLTGEIPPELFSLVNLSGYISPTMVGSILIHGLNLSDNLLSGEISSEIGNLINLISIDFSQNQFIGGMPSEIFNLINLESLNLSDNQLTGEISSEISNLINLSGIVTTGHMSITTYPALDLSENQFSGLIPESLCSLPIEWDYNSFGESEFSIDENQFCPPYPSCIEDYVGEQDTSNCEQGWDCIADDGTEGVELWGECYSIENTDSLDLNNSGLTGEISPEIGNLTNLTFLELSQNQLTGTIPTEIGNLINLNFLSLWENQLTGNIPESLWDLVLLESLDLDGNQLTGSISPAIGNLTNLVTLFLSANQLTGEIPSEIGNLINNHWLILSSNAFTGEIPSEIWNLTNLRALDLSNNQFTGSIPPEIGNLTYVERVVMHSNQFTGPIPSEIGNLTNLVRLKLHSNQLTGHIPETICNLSNLTWSLEDSLYSVSTLFGNQLCPPYSSCIEDYVGEQDITNCEQVSIIDETLPIAYNLYNAYPNPFNPITTLRYDLPEDALVNITIYDMMGRVVSNLVSSQQNAGYKSVQWNATNNQGQQVSAGLYLYTIQAGDYTQTKKMVLLK
ncbi:MAG: T9SS type A sorting domain-containing protein [Candidatus Marinimicrobia bacterium]|nr:T9SS type A sorting domain-containing protein [Candidatus Neomarinimicrobiota bacterium]